MATFFRLKGKASFRKKEVAKYPPDDRLPMSSFNPKNTILKFFLPKIKWNQRNK